MFDLERYWNDTLSEDAYEDAVYRKTCEIHRSNCDRFLHDGYESDFDCDDFGEYYRDLDDDGREDFDRDLALRAIGETYREFLEFKMHSFYQALEYNPRDVGYGETPIPALIGVWLGWDSGSIGPYDAARLWKEGFDLRYDYSYVLGFDIDIELFWDCDSFSIPAIYQLLLAVVILYENDFSDDVIWDFFDYYSQNVSPVEYAQSYIEAYLTGVPLEDIIA